MRNRSRFSKAKEKKKQRLKVLGCLFPKSGAVFPQFCSWEVSVARIDLQLMLYHTNSHFICQGLLSCKTGAKNSGRRLEAASRL
ncbi:hypothetical protein FKM82_022148 [Ascaphus truei]